MSVTVVTTVAGTASNSYITVAEGTTYHESHLYPDDWTNASPDERARAVVMATRLLDQWVDWKGYKATSDQALRWPRYDVVDQDGYVFDSDIYPQFLKDATAELARLLLAADTTKAPDTLGFSAMQIGDLSLTIDKLDRDRYGALPDSVLAIIEPYGEIRSRSGSGVVKLERV